MFQTFVVVSFLFFPPRLSLRFRRFNAFLAINKYICHPAGALRWGERNSSRAGGGRKKKLLCAALARCSKIVHRLLTHTDRALHKSLRSAEGAVGDATGHCFFPAVPLPPSSQSCQQLLAGFHLCLPASSHFSSDPSHSDSSFRTATQSQLQESPSRFAGGDVRPSPPSSVESFMSFFTVKC